MGKKTTNSTTEAKVNTPTSRGASRTQGNQQLGKLVEGLPPNALEAEGSLLGSILIDPSVLNDVQLIIHGADDFFKKANGLIFEAMVELYNKSSTVDLVQLQQLVSDRNLLEAVGGVDYLLEVAHAVPSAASASHYARLVKDKSVVRQLIAAAGNILQDAYTKPEDPQEILNDAESSNPSKDMQKHLSSYYAMQSSVLKLTKVARLRAYQRDTQVSMRLRVAYSAVK